MRKLIICEECGEEKEHQAKGLCRRCYDQKYHFENKEHYTNYNKRWYAENKEWFRKYRSKNKEQIQEYQREYYIENKEHHAESMKESYNKQGWAGNLKRNYNITIEQYNEMLKSQNNACWICGKTPEENGRRLAVDHDHNTGEIRGLLCIDCNQGLGRFKDSPRLLTRAIEYLEL